MLFTVSLIKNIYFQKVYKYGKSYSDKYLIVYYRKNELNINKIGISVSKKVGNSIVRHKVKRVIKEAYRLNEEKFIKGIDIVVIARPNAYKLDFFSAEKSLIYLFGRLKIIK